MHIKLLYRKVLYVFLSVMIVIANAQTVYAASAVGWSASPSDVIMNGASATITAIKGTGSSALQSTIKHAPTAANVGKKLIRGGGVVAIAYAVTQLAGDSVDYVLDPANNRVIYQQEIENPAAGGLASPYLYEPVLSGFYGTYPSPQLACHAAVAFLNNYTYVSSTTTNCQLLYYGQTSISVALNRYGNPNYNSSIPPTVSEEKYLPISTVASKVQANAVAGHAPSQDLLKTMAIEELDAGAFDVPLNIAAIPRVEAPSIPDPNAPPIDPAAPFDPSSIISAIKSVVASIANMSGFIGAKLDLVLFDMGIRTGEINSAINNSAGEIIASDEANISRLVVAIEGIEGNTLDGKVINDAIDRAIAAGATDTSSIVTAIQGIEGNTLDGQVINDAIDRAIANDNVNAQSAADAANAAADAAKAADAANTTAVTDAIEAQTDAITTTDPTTGEKSLKLPAFCGFAPVVCEYITWVKGEYGSVMEWVKAEPEVTPDDPIVVADDPSGLGNIFQDKAEAGYVSFESSCPADVLIPIDLMGASQVLNISYTPFCHFASMIRYAVILGAWISGLLIVTGGRSRE